MTTGTQSRAKGGPLRAPLTLISAGLIGVVLIAACGDGSSSGSSTDLTSTNVVASSTTEAAAATEPATSEPASTEPAANPELSTEDTTMVTAPDSERVDLAEPRFSNPTAVTNPLFPIAELDQVIQLGEEAGAALRFEVTLLPETKMIEWNGQQVETLVSQFVAYEDGRVLEVAVDFFAQADDGAVWYFGESVANYVDGAIDNTDGTWLAGKDGPPGMIMPADPQLGDVYRPENIPGFVFEEVTVKSVNETVEGPIGPVDGAITVQERLMDGLLEDKTFAPGYGEFFFAVEAEQEVVNMALAVPTDAATGAVPAELTTLASGVDDISAAVATGDWEAISTTLGTMTTAWETYRAGDVPPLLEAQMSDALDALASAADGRNAPATSEAAIDVGNASLDLQLQFRPPADVDQDRLGLWARQLELDQAAGDAALTAGDQVVIETIRQRIGQA
jgi:hypothetical protein